MSGSCLQTDSARGERSSSCPARRGRQKLSQGQRRHHVDPCPQPRASFWVPSLHLQPDTGEMDQKEGPSDWEEPVTTLDYWSPGVFRICLAPLMNRQAVGEARDSPGSFSLVNPANYGDRETENKEMPRRERQHQGKTPLPPGIRAAWIFLGTSVFRPPELTVMG